MPFSTTLTIDCDESDFGYELAVRFGPDDLEWSQEVETLDHCRSILGGIVVDALKAEQRRQRLEYLAKP